MTLRHMKIFLTVCEQDNSVTRAAKVLYMTQPSVSLAIREIEKHYGVTLFDRIARRLYLTQAGREYREYAMRATAMMEDMEKRFANWDARGSLRIGASMTIGACMMPSFTREFRRLSPGCDVRVTVRKSRDLEEKLKTNELDLALVETQVHEDVLHAEEYRKDELRVIVPRIPPYRDGMTFTLEELCGRDLILREKGSGTREIFDRILAENGYAAEPVWETMSTTALISAVSGGIGISVLPGQMALQAAAKKEVWLARVEGIRFTQHYYLVWHRDKYRNPAMEEFIRMVRASGNEMNINE